MRNTVLAAVLILILASLGFAQGEPAAQDATATATAEATATVVTTAPVAPTPPVEVKVPEVQVGTKQVEVRFNVEVPIDTPLKGGVASGIIADRTRPLSQAEQRFLATVPNGYDASGQSYRGLIELAFRAGIAHAETAPAYGSVDARGRVFDYHYYCGLVQPADASKNVSGRIQDTLHGTATGTIEIPTVTVGSTTRCIPAPQPVYVQPPAQPAPAPVPQPAYCPPPPRPVVYLQVQQWAAAPTAPVYPPGTITTYGQPAFLGGGFSYNAGTRITLSNNSGSNSSATGGTGYGGNSWAQGGNAWQNQGQGQFQGQTSWNNNQNRLDNNNQWNNANQNTLTGGDQNTNVGVSNNTGVAVH